VQHIDLPSHRTVSTMSVGKHFRSMWATLTVLRLCMTIKDPPQTIFWEVRSLFNFSFKSRFQIKFKVNLKLNFKFKFNLKVEFQFKLKFETQISSSPIPKLIPKL
jgi:hypothetical protein